MDNNTATNTSKNDLTYGLTESTENYTSSYFNYNTRLTYTEENTTTPTPQPNSSNGSIVCVAIVTAVVSLAALVIGIALLFLRRKSHRHGREKLKSYIKCSEDVSDEVSKSKKCTLHMQNPKINSQGHYSEIKGFRC